MKCSIVATELVAAWSETPDAIGWNGALSILVECKANKEDFLADRNKRARLGRDEWSMGNRRFYLVPNSLKEFALENLKERWGLLVAHKTRVNTIVKSEHFKDTRKTDELLMLISIIRRIAGERKPITGVNVRCYTIGSDYPLATLGIEHD
ncbi:MAG: hypothetical protein GTO24_21310 [candidate division Zixibacteria bacterium]|nr:hypothetical protein [candidate division Zixibacteria bacterium]